MVVVSVSEVFDLHTEVDKMTLIGIHTPKKELLMKTYPGLFMNYKYFRILSMDVALATSQRLALSWEQVGTDASQVHPQDAMNPILYKAVSNDSWSTLEARIHGIALNGSNITGNTVDIENDEATGLADEHLVYYSLLANRDGFKIADPQRGLSMKGLRPLVFEKLYNHAENIGFANADENDGVAITPNLSAEGHPLKLQDKTAYTIRGHPRPMPRINTTYVTASDYNSDAPNRVENGLGYGVPKNCQANVPDVPPVMLGAIIIPPATALAGILYYRMVTRCYVEFTDVRPIQEITSFADMNSHYGPVIYHSDYISQSRRMDQVTDMVDIKNGEIKKVMEGR